jgi:hypothetical protein
MQVKIVTQIYKTDKYLGKTAINEHLMEEEIKG